MDWTGGQIKDDDDASDIRDVDLTQVHYLSGPIDVHDPSGEVAHPGDLLCVEICDLGPLPGDEWGFTGASPLACARAFCAVADDARTQALSTATTAAAS